MPGTVADGAPSVALSFANNFWGKDDAGVGPLLDRMHNAKVTGDELKAFYSARAAIEDEYARKLLNLARKPLGSGEEGTLRMSLDVVRGEIESIGKAHQNVANQMKSDLDEQLGTFHGGMKERRKIVQTNLERLLKTKQTQSMNVTKTRDRYEQDCLKIKGYLAQGHMVMGQEERKNKAKLEKTQINLSTTSNEYEANVKALEETTGKWNREWKVACDKFQDLEEERIDFMKSSLWTFANIASTVCVSDDASCEKIRLSLEDCDVEKDIATFIREHGTGQEIPDPPKFINFCQENANEANLGLARDENYSVAQFQRTGNPAFRTSSPQPSSYESHQESPRGAAAHDEYGDDGERESSATPRRPSYSFEQQRKSHSGQAHESNTQDDPPEVPHNEYPPDGMTQFCRLGPPSEHSSVNSQMRPSSRDSQAQSDVSNPTTFTEPSSLGAPSPTKSMSDMRAGGPEHQAEKKRSGFFQNRSPFRRRSKGEKDRPQAYSPASNRDSWAKPQSRSLVDLSQSASNKPQGYGEASHSRMSASPEPVDPRASFQLNVGNNVFDVASPDRRSMAIPRQGKPGDDVDPIAQALAELKGVSKQASVRTSADNYAGIGTPGSGANGSGRGYPGNKSSPRADRSLNSAQRSAPPPAYDQGAVGRLGAPQPAFTSRQMQQTTQKYIDQKQNMFNTPTRDTGSRYDQQQSSRRTTPQSRPGTSAGNDRSRATSPVPLRSASPRPSAYGEYPPRTSQDHSRATSPNPYAGRQYNGSRPRAQSTTPVKPRGDGYGYHPGSSHGYGQVPRATSPQPQFNNQPQNQGSGNMALQLAPASAAPPAAYGAHGGVRGRPGGRPVSQYGGSQPEHDSRMRSKSAAAGGREFSRDGRPILHFSRAMYMYTAAIPEELSFAKNDVLAVLRHQDDGWWEAEAVDKRGMPGLVPSNYLTDA